MQIKLRPSGVRHPVSGHGNTSISEKLLPPHSTLKVELPLFVLSLDSLKQHSSKLSSYTLFVLEHRYEPGTEIQPNTALAKGCSHVNLLTNLSVSESPTDEGSALGTSSQDDVVIVLKNKLLTNFK